MAQVVMNRAEHITFDHCAFQGSLNKLEIGEDCVNIRNINGDVEGAGVYLNISGVGGNVRSIHSIANAFQGFTGTYIAGEANINEELFLDMDAYLKLRRYI